MINTLNPSPQVWVIVMVTQAVYVDMNSLQFESFILLISLQLCILKKYFTSSVHSKNNILVCPVPQRKDNSVGGEHDSAVNNYASYYSDRISPRNPSKPLTPLPPRIPLLVSQLKHMDDCLSSDPALWRQVTRTLSLGGKQSKGQPVRFWRSRLYTCRVWGHFLKRLFVLVSVSWRLSPFAEAALCDVWCPGTNPELNHGHSAAGRSRCSQ